MRLVSRVDQRFVEVEYKKDLFDKLIYFQMLVGTH